MCGVSRCSKVSVSVCRSRRVWEALKGKGRETRREGGLLSQTDSSSAECTKCRDFSAIAIAILSDKSQRLSQPQKCPSPLGKALRFFLRRKIASDCDSFCDFSRKKVSPLRFGGGRCPAAASWRPPVTAPNLCASKCDRGSFHEMASADCLH